jgi:hypothetical protein
MGDWKASDEQVKWITKLAIGKDLEALAKLAGEVGALYDSVAALRSTVRETKERVEWAEMTMLLTGKVTGKNEAERKGNLAAALIQAGPLWQNDSALIANTEAEIGRQEAQIKATEKQYDAVALAVKGKAAILTFLGSTSG